MLAKLPLLASRGYTRLRLCQRTGGDHLLAARRLLGSPDLRTTVGIIIRPPSFWA